MATAVDLNRIASAFLRALKAPDTYLMRQAVIVWLRKEGISSVRRNNPWNLHQGAPCGGVNDRGRFCPRSVLPGQIGVVNVAPGDRNVAVFRTLDDGVRANANNLVRLSKSGYGYDRVIAYAQRGDPVGFLHALARSSWSAGRYGTAKGGANSLITIWNGLTGRKDDPYGYKRLQDLKPAPVGGGSTSSGGSSPSEALARLQEWLGKGPSERITDADIDTIMRRAGITFDPTGSVRNSLTLALKGKTLREAASGDFLALIGDTAAQIASPLARAADILGFLADPGNWIRILALMAGGGLIALGTWRLVTMPPTPTSVPTMTA